MHGAIFVLVWGWGLVVSGGNDDQGYRLQAQDNAVG